MQEDGNANSNSGVVNIAANEQKNANSLLEQLEKTAGNMEDSTNTNLRKRRRSGSEDDGNDGDDNGKSVKMEEDGNNQQQEGPKQKRSRYDEIMQKGNERTKKAFQVSKPKEEATASDNDEPDDEKVGMRGVEFVVVGVEDETVLGVLVIVMNSVIFLSAFLFSFLALGAA